MKSPVDRMMRSNSEADEKQCVKCGIRIPVSSKKCPECGGGEFKGREGTYGANRKVRKGDGKRHHSMLFKSTNCC